MSTASKNVKKPSVFGSGFSKPKVSQLPSHSNYEVKAAIEQAKDLAQDATAYDYDEIDSKPL